MWVFCQLLRKISQRLEKKYTEKLSKTSELNKISMGNSFASWISGKKVNEALNLKLLVDKAFL